MLLTVIAPVVVGTMMQRNEVLLPKALTLGFLHSSATTTATNYDKAARRARTNITSRAAKVDTITILRRRRETTRAKNVSLFFIRFNPANNTQHTQSLTHNTFRCLDQQKTVIWIYLFYVSIDISIYKSYTVALYI